MKLFTFPLVCMLCFSCAVIAQQPLKRFNLQEPTPIISLSADISRYWNVETEDTDTLDPIVQEHYETLERGRRYSFRIGYHASEFLCIGLQFAHASTSHATPSAHWIINGVNRYGSISESIYQNFYGVFLERYIPIDREYQFGIGLSPGIVSFVQYSDYAGIVQTLDGTDLAIDLYVDALYKMDQNWSFYARGSFYNATIVEPFISSPHFARTAVPDYPLNIGYFRVGAGIRYTFVQK